MEKLKVEYVAIESIKPYEKNAKLHPKEQIEQIKKSIEQFGMNDPLGIWHDEIVEGHGRLIACKELGMTEIPIIRLDHLTDEERKAYILAHNKLTMNSDFDMDVLNEELSKFETIDMTDFGFDLDFMDVEEEEIIEDEIPEVPEEPKSKLGQVYQLGNHRLMCGDSTNEEDVKKLMNGKLADLVLTDPPYNVAIENSQGMKIKNDNMGDSEFLNFLTKAFACLNLALKEGGVFYVWFASREHINFETALNNNNLEVRQELIWNKSSLIIGRQDYQWKHEPCLYGWKEGAGHYFGGDRKQTTVIDWDKPSKCDLHPTMKPVGLFDYQIKNSSRKNEIVLDLFGGSGTTIIACEQNGRNAYVMEYDPKYVDVIIERWENLTGKKAVLLDD